VRILCISFLCLLLSVHMCILLLASPSVLWYCWLGLLTCKNRVPYNLYCVGGDVKHCTIQSFTILRCLLHPIVSRYCRLLFHLLFHTITVCISLFFCFIYLQLVLNEKGFLNQRRTVILHQGEGPIKNIKWKGSLIAWSNELVCNYQLIRYFVCMSCKL